MPQHDLDKLAEVPELIARWQAGDESAATELFQRYQQKLLRLVASHLNEKFQARLGAEDLMISIFRSAFRVSRQGGFEVNDDTGFWKWLVTVALNKTFKRIARESAGKRDPDRESAGTVHLDAVVANRASQMPTTAEVVEAADLLERIRDRLDERQQQVLLHKLEGFSQKEIAGRLKVSDKTVQRDFQDIRAAAKEVAGDDACEWS